MNSFVLKEEQYLDQFSEIGRYKSYEAAMAEAARRHDSGSDSDFIICDDDEQVEYYVHGYLLDLERCPICDKEVRRYQMQRTYDCHGIPFRLVCEDCNDRIMRTTGYDGERYDERDEQIEADY